MLPYMCGELSHNAGDFITYARSSMILGSEKFLSVLVRTYQQAVAGGISLVEE